MFTGLSGSGKSSLAFDTLFAEGQRRYIETFSSYARQFIGGMERPDVDKIEGLSLSYPLNKKQFLNPRGQPLGQLPSFTTFSDYCFLEWQRPILLKLVRKW